MAGQRARTEHLDLPVVLLGHSMGGLVAARYAQRYGNSLAALVLSSPVLGRWDAVTALLGMEEIPDEPLDVSTLSRDASVGEVYAGGRHELFNETDSDEVPADVLAFIREQAPGDSCSTVGYAAAMFRRSLWQGLVAGAVGATVMTVSEKLEQRFTGRPSSYVPARVLERLFGLPEQKGRQSLLLNWAMHYGQGALAGVVRSLMANAGLRGPWASAKFAVVRLTNDQVLENATGVGAPPQTWPRQELGADVLHKAVYAFTTGVVADALAARSGPGPGQRHASLRPGRHADVGPLPRSG